jgi:hypothetical protein
MKIIARALFFSAYLIQDQHSCDYSVLSFAFIDKPPGLVPLGLSAWKEKSISPTSVLTCLISNC